MIELELLEIINRIDSVSISQKATITQLKREEDGELYQVRKIDSDGTRYILKEAKGSEKEIYQSVLANLKGSVPSLYQAITIDEKSYFLLEYIEGEDLCKCNRTKLTNALDALIFIQQKNVGNSSWQPMEILV